MTEKGVNPLFKGESQLDRLMEENGFRLISPEWHEQIQNAECNKSGEEIHE